MLLGGRLARDDLETVFPSYVSGDEQYMRRAKWFPAGSSVLAWMRDRDSAFQVGQPASLRLTRISGQFCVRPTSSQTSLPTMPQGGSAATRSNNRRVLVDRRPASPGSCEDSTVDDLRKRARELGISGYSGKNKSELVSILTNH